MNKKMVAGVEIVRVKNLQRTKEEDQVITETPLTLFVNDMELVTLLCSPNKMECLAIGFLCSEGLLKTAADILSMKMDLKRNIISVKLAAGKNIMKELYYKRTITSGGGKGTLFFNIFESLPSKPVQSLWKISAQKLLALMSELQEKSVLHKATGGVHIAALADTEGILFYCEDIGRHNAVDKTVGECILEDIPLENKIFLTSGRLSSEMVIKAARLYLPLLVSRSAPTSLSVELAAKLGITLVGFARDGRLNIYTHDSRIY